MSVLPVILLGLFLFLSSCTSSPAPLYGAPNFQWPVHKGKITQGFKASSKKHQGLDISGRRNTPIYAAESGKVIYAGKEFTGYGKLIIIEHRGDTWASFYAHLNDFSVSEGDSVSKGEKIGLMGRTGRTTGIHLHFEIRHNLRPVDPLQYLNSRKYLTSN